MKKYLTFAAFALLMSATTFSLSSCGGDDDDSDVNGNDSSQEQAEKPLTPAGKAAGAVDLGLPSGTLWADRNVGADKAEAYGDYFAWGETTTKTEYAWYTYNWGTSFGQLTKYCNKSEYGKDGYTDAANPEIGKELTELLKEDDAAYVNWGGKWRMPTSADITELINYTNKEWVSDYNGTGVNGRKFTNKNDASKFIFMPAAGYRSYTGTESVGSYGYYWSSSLTSVPFHPYFLQFGSGSFVKLEEDYDRFYGLAVRPVRK